jgi:hypothetical protein
VSIAGESGWIKRCRAAGSTFLAPLKWKKLEENAGSEEMANGGRNYIEMQCDAGKAKVKRGTHDEGADGEMRRGGLVVTGAGSFGR